LLRGVGIRLTGNQHLTSTKITHRQLNIVGLSLAASIIFMRPAVAVIMVVETEWEFGRALGLAVWVVFIWSTICAAVYVINAYTLPTMRFPRLQHNGEIVTTGCAHCPLEKMVTGIVSIVSFKCLDSRTVLLRLATNKFRNVEQIGDDKNEVFNPIFPIGCPPGSHIALKVGDVVREFTPISSSESANEIEIVIRLVRKGAFSSVLLPLLGLDLDGPQRTGWTECSIDCGVYGPLLPLPARFGYRPYYSPVSSCRNDPYRPTLIMIGGGSGVMPFFGIIAAALKNKDDRMTLKLLSLSGSSQGTKGSGPDSSSDFGTYIEDKINQLYISSKNEKDSGPAVTSRFEGVNSRERFQTSMLDSWIPDPTGQVSKDSSAVRTPARSTIVWICGPPGFGEDCRIALMAQKGFHRDQIFMLGIEDR
jgi:NAD(P)H-flavin reductase